MISLYRQILEFTLFPMGQATKGLVLLPGLDQNDMEAATGIGLIPEDLFPESCEISTLSNGEGFIDELRETLAAKKPERLFILPPFLHFKRLSEEIRSRFSRMNLEEMALLVAVETLPPGCLIGSVLPLPFFFNESSLNTRERLIQLTAPKFIIVQGDLTRHRVFSNFDPRFKMQTLILETGKKDPSKVCFFKCSQVDDLGRQKDILKDLERLSKQEGGKTRYGYVLREGIPSGTAWLYDLHDPVLQQKVEDLRSFGKVNLLGDLVEFKRGLNLARNAHQLLSGDEDTIDEVKSIPLIEGRNIRSDNSLIHNETRYRVLDAPPEYHLQAGDICMQALTGPGQNLRVVRIDDYMLPLVASDTIITLRPRDASILNIDFLIDYLRSDSAIQFLRAQGVSIGHINLKYLEKLPVPVLDEMLDIAWKNLKEATKAFEEWKVEAEQALNSVFNFPSAKDARLHLLSTGRKVRQRQRASYQVDDLSYRIRTGFPHPIAYRWRTVEAARPDMEGYVHLLECAEVMVCYLACIAILAAKAVDHGGIGYLKNMATNLLAEKGTSFGDWLSILREVNNSKIFRKTSEIIPFYEVTRFVDAKVDRNLQLLKDNRDDQSHGRGPKGQDVPVKFEESLEALKPLLQSIEFISEYSLRYIEDTRRDSIAGITSYTYRNLMGDHPLVPLSTGETISCEIEARSLYLTDLTGELYLLRPLLSRYECPKCGRWATFYLDTYQKDGDLCILKGMEHSHVSSRKESDPQTREPTSRKLSLSEKNKLTIIQPAEAFRYIGLLPVKS